MMTFGLVATLLAILVMAVHEEAQYWLTLGYRWWRRRHRPTRWTAQEQRLIVASVVRMPSGRR